MHRRDSPVSPLISPQRSAAGTTLISSQVRTANCRLCSNISQILLLHKTCGYHSKFDSMKSLWVCFWYLQILRCGHMQHGLKYIAFYVKKHDTVDGVFWSRLVRDKTLEAPAFDSHIIAENTHWLESFIMYHFQHSAYIAVFLTKTLTMDCDVR